MKMDTVFTFRPGRGTRGLAAPVNLQGDINRLSIMIAGQRNRSIGATFIKID
jgi:hypothetical protein